MYICMCFSVFFFLFILDIKFVGRMYLCIVTHICIARVWINRVRLPILHAVS